MISDALRFIIYIGTRYERGTVTHGESFRLPFSIGKVKGKRWYVVGVDVKHRWPALYACSIPNLAFPVML